MKKRRHVTLLAALLAISGASNAWAQSNVSVYGILDASVETLSFNGAPGAPSSRLTALASDTSRLGLRGSEDLGDGLKAYFKIEHGLQLDTGAQTSPSAFWNREAYVGLSGEKLGFVQLGSQFAPALWMSLKVDPFTRFGVGGQYTLLQGLRGYQWRVDNALQYITPTIAGVSARLLAAPGEGSETGATYAGQLEYSQGPLYVGVVVDQVKAAAATVGLSGTPMRSRTVSLAATYDFGLVKLRGWAQTNRIDGLASVDGYLVGVTVPIGTGEIKASYADRRAGLSSARLAAVGYQHSLSKRTQLYANVGRLINDIAASFRMGPAVNEQAAIGRPAAGQDTVGTQVGIRHFF